MWVPDTSARGFADEYARQARLLSSTIESDLEMLLDEITTEIPDWEQQE